MSKYKTQSMAKMKCGEVEVASVRSKEAAKVQGERWHVLEYSMPSSANHPDTGGAYPALCHWKWESEACQQH